MHRFTYFYSLAFVICSGILSSTAWGKSAETAFDNSFYISKICTAYMSKDDHEYCDDGYILKSETLNNSEVIEAMLMNGMDGIILRSKKSMKILIMFTLVAAVLAVLIGYLVVTVKSKTLAYTLILMPKVDVRLNTMIAKNYGLSVPSSLIVR